MTSIYGKVEEVQKLVASRKYREAIAILQGQLRHDEASVWLRQQLADVLVLAGQRDDALEVLDTLVETFVSQGFVQKAIAVVKRMQRLSPGDPANDARLAAIVGTHEHGPTHARVAAPPGPAAESPSDAEARRQREFQAALRRPSDTRFAREQRGVSGAEEAPPQMAEPAVPTAVPPAVPPVVPTAVTPLQEGFLLPAPAEAEIYFAEIDFTPVTADPALAGLARSLLFGQFPPDDLLAVVRSLDLRLCEPGEILVTEGEPGSSLFVLVSGSARVYVRAADGSSHEVRRLGEGEFFGEISLLTGQPRSATIVTATRCELLELDAATVTALAADHPQVPIVVREICDRRAGSREELAARAPNPTP